MKSLLVTFAILALTVTANARSLKFDAVQSGAKNAELILKVLNSKASGVTQESKELLAKVVNGQDSDNRVSITYVSCSVTKLDNKGNSQKSCDIEIGTDDLQDDDSGFGSIQRVTVDGVIVNGEFQVKAATLFFIAG